MVRVNMPGLLFHTHYHCFEVAALGEAFKPRWRQRTTRE